MKENPFPGITTGQLEKLPLDDQKRYWSWLADQLFTPQYKPSDYGQDIQAARRDDELYGDQDAGR